MKTRPGQVAAVLSTVVLLALVVFFWGEATAELATAGEEMADTAPLAGSALPPLGQGEAEDLAEQGPYVPPITVTEYPSRLEGTYMAWTGLYCETDPPRTLPLPEKTGNLKTSYVSDNVAIVIGSGGVFIHGHVSWDWGESWTPFELKLNKYSNIRELAIGFTTPEHGWIRMNGLNTPVEAYQRPDDGQIFETLDGGKTWECLSLYTVHADYTDSWATARVGWSQYPGETVQMTTDAGQSWWPVAVETENRDGLYLPYWDGQDWVMEQIIERQPESLSDLHSTYVWSNEAGRFVAVPGERDWQLPPGTDPARLEDFLYNYACLTPVYPAPGQEAPSTGIYHNALLQKMRQTGNYAANWVSFADLAETAGAMYSGLDFDGAQAAAAWAQGDGGFTLDEQGVQAPYKHWRPWRVVVESVTGDGEGNIAVQLVYANRVPVDNTYPVEYDVELARLRCVYRDEGHDFLFALQFAEVLAAEEAALLAVLEQAGYSL